jgi:hypothetical protein
MNLGTIGTVEIVLTSDSIKNLVIGVILISITVFILVIITKKIN